MFCMSKGKEIELEPEERILSSRVKILENRINNLKTKIEELKNHMNKPQEEEILENTEFKEQTIVLKDSKGAKMTQLNNAITNFENKYIVKLPFKDVLGIRITVKIKLKPNITYKNISFY